MEQKPKSRWRPSKNRVVRAIKVATVLIAMLIASISIWALFDSGYVREAIGILLLLTLILIRIGYRYEWTGFGETTRPKSDTQEVQPRKTLWDWLGLLIVPLVLAVGGFVFAIQQDARQVKIENQLAARERQLEEQRAQDAALQAPDPGTSGRRMRVAWAWRPFWSSVNSDHKLRVISDDNHGVDVDAFLVVHRV